MVEKKKLSIIIYYDSKSKLVFLFSSLFPPSLSLSLFYTHSALFLSRDKAINYKLRSISIHADVRRYQDHHRWKHRWKQKRIFVTVFHRFTLPANKLSNKTQIPDTRRGDRGTELHKGDQKLWWHFPGLVSAVNGDQQIEFQPDRPNTPKLYRAFIPLRNSEKKRKFVSNLFLDRSTTIHLNFLHNAGNEL